MNDQTFKIILRNGQEVVNTAQAFEAHSQAVKRVLDIIGGRVEAVRACKIHRRVEGQEKSRDASRKPVQTSAETQGDFDF